LIYRVIVNSDGSILRTEKISGDSDLHAVADPFVSGWHFKEVDISGLRVLPGGALSACAFFRDGDYMLPCYLPQAEDERQDIGYFADAALFVGDAGALL